MARKMKKKEAEEIGRQALLKVGMPDRSGFYPSQLSGGQQCIFVSEGQGRLQIF